MSGFVAEDGGPAVSSDDFRAALMGDLDPGTTPDATAPEPARDEATQETPATTAPEAQPTPPPAETPAAQTPDELATLRAEMAALREEQSRQRDSYAGNIKQHQEAAQRAQREADAARAERDELARHQTDAAETAFKNQIAAWEGQVRAAPDGPEKTAARAFIDAEIAKHEAEARTAEARRTTEALAPVAQELQRLRASNDLAATVQQHVGLIHDEGATQLAAEVGAPVAEVRAYLQRPEVSQQYLQVFALMKQAELAGQPVPVGLLTGLGQRDRAYWAERMQDRKAAEAREVERNGRDLVASGATRADGNGGQGAPPKGIETFADVTRDAFAGALERGGIKIR